MFKAFITTNKFSNFIQMKVLHFSCRWSLVPPAEKKAPPAGKVKYLHENEVTNLISCDEGLKHVTTLPMTTKAIPGSSTLFQINPCIAPLEVWK
ncbi:hypothetical protein QL285_044605 [Trifolium repens]|nr:hypothetical protein QL285_044605 [Trifolium repens]